MSRAARDALAATQVDLAAVLLDALDDMRPGQGFLITRSAEVYVDCCHRRLAEAIRAVKAAEPAALAEWAQVEAENDRALAEIVT